MAIIFTKDISETNIINAYNNNIVEFKSDSLLNSIRCDILINSEIYKITPNADNKFRFNFGGKNQSPFPILLNQNNFSDDKILNVYPSDVNTLVIDNNTDTFLVMNVTYTIIFDNNTSELINKTYYVLKSIEQIRGYNDRIILKDNFQWLSPFDKSEYDITITYFRGYPMDIGFLTTNDEVPLTINWYTSPNILTEDYVNRLIISDGINGIHNFNNFINFVIIYFADFTPLIKLNLNVRYECGEYLKFMNRYGLWSYWLFNGRSQEILQTKNLKPIFNDFYNINENKSPYLETGKIGITQINLHSTNIRQFEMNYLIDLFISPKVYYFIGNKDEKVNFNSWVEVKFKGQKTKIKKYKGHTYEINGIIELPLKNTMKL